MNANGYEDWDRNGWERKDLELNAKPGHCIPEEEAKEFFAKCPNFMTVAADMHFNLELGRYDGYTHMHYEWEDGI